MSGINGRQEIADEAVRSVLRTQYDGVTALRLDSPPGAGKTGVVERLAVQSMASFDERCMVVTETNEQAFDLSRRCATYFPKLPFTLMVRKTLRVPEGLEQIPNLNVARSSGDVPRGPCIVIANARKWSWSDVGHFDSQIIDEAFQLPDYGFHQVAGMADRFVLVGDPGQIAPVVTCEIERWRCDASGPHVPAPSALTARHPDVLRMSLPMSRRLVADTVRFVQPAFYPQLPFEALSLDGERQLLTTAAGGMKLDRLIQLAEAGASVVQVELPSLITGEADEQLSDSIVEMISRLLVRGAFIQDEVGERPLVPSMIGVACAHTSQVNAVRERLPPHCGDVLVETAHRFQGLEREVMLVHHPLSGRADADSFHLDAGILCVMMSRHRVACFMFARSGIEELLSRHAPSGDRVLGSQTDEEFEGWRAHRSILERLRHEQRIIAV
jgi:hypothetical protein